MDGVIITALRDNVESSAMNHPSSSSSEDDRLAIASVFLDDAVHGRDVDCVPQPRQIRIYRLYKQPWLSLFLILAYLAYLGLALFEAPQAVDNGALTLPFWATVTVEFVCLAVFALRLFHEMLFCDRRVFWKETKHVTLTVILALIVVDIVIYAVMREVGLVGIRWSRPLRPLIIVNYPELAQVWQGLKNIRRTLPQIANVLCLFFASTALFSLMAYKLFGNKKTAREEEGYFQDYFESLWEMYVLVTTANHPDIMLPALSRHKYFALFFILYLIINLYMFMSVFLAVVYNQFRQNLKNEVRESLARSEKLISEVFAHVRGEDGRLERSRYFRLMSAAFPSLARNYVETLWMVVDAGEEEKEKSGRRNLSKEAFHEILDVMKLRYVDITPKSNVLDRHFPRMYGSKPSRIVIRLVRHRRFRNVFDFVIVVNAIFIGLDMDGGENYFLAIFFLEIVLKIYTFGFRAFFSKKWNIFDIEVVGSALMATMVHLVEDKYNSTAVLDFLLVLRVVRIFKVFHAFPRFRTVLNTLISILPSAATYGSIVFIIFYFFSIIGMESFHGKIRSDDNVADNFCGNARLQNSTFVRSRYCLVNFNDLPSALITLFALMIVNQWHVIAEGFTLVTSKWARIYFVSFHMLCVIIIINIFTAFVLEAFILEYSVTKSGLRSRLNERVSAMGLSFSASAAASMEGVERNDDGSLLDADHESFEEEEGDLSNKDGVAQVEDGKTFKDLSTVTPIRFKLSSRPKSVQHLLERMFEKDLSPTNL